ncbi:MULTISPECIES: flagellar hook-associated protein FlgL [unclassified Campylobacter]|uniref:flagellar hook-associated protein FlgL n=1 Tax=unclassified Campylobacter TaxID=2593542 RepID=UPI0021E66682|nr:MULTISPECIES: flagellar hook-associated protein FlgL [unclassified Campylobacter]HEC1728296.1 flagellar hook-associated protein FlgL [Campylobacter lari]MCV3397070.1 flagellar hook-associated protein FlgL [Campylobacter sp. RKI_CA19_01116]MCV3472372.1 flagellar hook-associated protein FlgL [Campylobacter sp. CNRCH_2015_0338h]MCV3482181.1 flagellar hook-associated protein FlgL [Campylobacter sp. CNRCH_2014_0184h]HEC1764555.1 flagellar hook-associated protein FlgL [Campylobacter lari]
MRISNQYTYYTSIQNYTDGQSLLNKYNLQLQTGQLIQHSWENANTYINGSRLEYELANIGQVIEGTQSAMELAKNTDTALKNITELLEKFKTLLTKAASDGNSQESREAIAKELKLVRDSIVNIANTSINGQYLFAGSNSANMPFDKYGNYTGNKDNIFVVSGAGTQIPYNIPGWDLFFKPDSNINKIISTNVSFTDARYPDKKEYLTGESKFSHLIGQNYVQNGKLDPDKNFEDSYDEKLPFPHSSMYIQGVRPDGTSFKATLDIDPDAKIEDVLENIGKLYGNTEGNEVVKVALNDSGQIEIKSLKEGSSSLDFHAVAMTPQLQDAEQIKALSEAAQREGISMDEVTNRIMQAAHNGDLNNTKSPVTVEVGGEQFTVDIYKTDFIKSNINGNKTNGADFDVPFEKDGNTVFGNVSQVIKGTSEYATDSTKLSEVVANANGSMDGQQLQMEITSRSGQKYNVTIDLENSTVSYPDPNNPDQTISFPITHSQYNEATGTSVGMQTRPEDITYGQLNDIIGMFASDNVPTATITPNANGTINNNDFQTIQQDIADSKGFVEVSMDYKGRISITDKFSTNTNIGLTIKDSNSNSGFPPAGEVSNGSGFVFSANNSLTIDDPNIDLIKDLDEMIDAVLNGSMRADSEGSDPRNTGLQGALERIDHLQDHVRKMQTTIGAYTNNIEETNKRMTFLNVNVASIKSGVTDADYGQTYMMFMQTMVSYQAMLSATSKISQMSLLNYL